MASALANGAAKQRAGGRLLLRRVSRGWRLAAAVVCVLSALVVPGIARADGPGAWSDPCSSDINPASCERLTWLAEHQADASVLDHSDTWALIGVVAVGLLAPGFFRVLFA